MRLLNKELAVYLVEFNYVLVGFGYVGNNVSFYKGGSTSYVVWEYNNKMWGNIIHKDAFYKDPYEQINKFWIMCKRNGISTITAANYSPVGEAKRKPHILKFRLDYSKTK